MRVEPEKGDLFEDGDDEKAARKSENVWQWERERERGKRERERERERGGGFFLWIDTAQDLFPLTTFHSLLCELCSESVMNQDEMKHVHKKSFSSTPPTPSFLFTISCVGHFHQNSSNCRPGPFPRSLASNTCLKTTIGWLICFNNYGIY